MKLILIAFFTSLSIHTLYGQRYKPNANRAIVQDYRFRPQGVLYPFVQNWSRHRWSTFDDTPVPHIPVSNYINTNTIDDLPNYVQALNDYDNNVGYMWVDEYVRNQHNRPAPHRQQTLTEYLRYNHLNDLVLDQRFISNNDVRGYGRSAGAGVPYSTPRPVGQTVRLVPDSMIAARPFRLATLASIGYGNEYRFY